jgi:hypothetical protein
MSEKKSKETSFLAKAQYREILGDYVGAIREVYAGLCEDPHDAALLKKREELLGVICWRC